MILDVWKLILSSLTNIKLGSVGSIPNNQYLLIVYKKDKNYLYVHKLRDNAKLIKVSPNDFKVLIP